MIAIKEGRCRTATQVAKDLNVHVGTVHRWISPGILDPDGKRIPCGAFRRGGRWIITDEALAVFFSQLTPGQADSHPLRDSTAREVSSC